MNIDGVKVFSATKFKERQALGDRLNEWMAEHPEFEIVETKVTQSSDSEFHCLSITVFYKVNGTH